MENNKRIVGFTLFVLVLALSSFNSALANSPTSSTPDTSTSSLGKGSIRLSAGIGAGMLGADVYGYLNNSLSNSVAFVQSTSFVPTLKAECFIDKQSSIGLSYAYQSVTGSYYFPSSWNYYFGYLSGPAGTVPNVSEKITRSVLTLSYQHYFQFRKQQQFFVAGNIGIAIYKDAVTNSDPNSNYGYLPAPTTGHASMVGNSISIQGGYLYQVNDNLGFHAALGFGVLEPYVFNLGVNYTFKKKLVVK